MDKDKQILNLTQENKCLKSFILHHIPDLVAINYFDNFEVKTILLDSYAELEEFAYKKENEKLKRKNKMYKACLKVYEMWAKQEKFKREK